jgi:hypothetical protein
MSWCARSLYFGSGLILVAAVGNAAAFCQTQQPVTRPEFEVASIRPHANGDNRAYVQASEGRLAMANFSLKQLILFAYNVPNNQVSGVQAWMDSNHFDIQATTESAPTVKQLEGPMLQALLEERFQLKIHREAVERSVYELTVEKGGVKMQLSKEGSCTPYSMDSPPPHPVFCDFPRFGKPRDRRKVHQWIRTLHSNTALLSELRFVPGSPTISANGSTCANTDLTI